MPFIFCAKKTRDIEAILRIALEKGADAIHPGNSYLAESPAFASACADAGVTLGGAEGDAFSAARWQPAQARTPSADATLTSAVAQPLLTRPIVYTPWVSSKSPSAE